MGANEEGTLAQLKEHRRELGDPKIREHRGHIVKTTGDGMLVEFASAVDAVRCAIEIQRGMVERNADAPPEDRIEFRIGINVGDIIADDGDIFGNGVNVAARLEAIADRGGICISRQVLDQIEHKLELSFRELGRQNLKNISKPIEVYAVELHQRGDRASSILANASLEQEIRYCSTTDGVRLAYAKVGKGPALVRPAHWLGHLEYDWELPFYRHLLLVSRVNLRLSVTMRGAMDFRIGTSANFRWTRGLVTLRQSSMQQDSRGSHFLRCRKDARLPLRLRCGIRTASRILSFLEGLQLANSSVRVTRMPTENDLRR